MNVINIISSMFMKFFSWISELYRSAKHRTSIAYKADRGGDLQPVADPPKITAVQEPENAAQVIPQPSDWPTLFPRDPHRDAESIFPRISQTIFEADLDAVGGHGFVYRTNKISYKGKEGIRTFLPTVSREGMRYTNDFIYRYEEIDRFVNSRRPLESGEIGNYDVTLSLDVMKEIEDFGGPIDNCRGMYFYLNAIDCVRQQYIQNDSALNLGDPLSIEFVSRIAIDNLPAGRFWPDCIPPAASAAVHVPLPRPKNDPPLIESRYIQVWFGGWVNAQALDVDLVLNEAMNFNLRRILVDKNRI